MNVRRHPAPTNADTNKKKEAHRPPFLCTPSGIRTLDPLIKSQLLYQLS